MVRKNTSNQRTLSKKIARAKWDSLTFKQKETRLKALEALSAMRQDNKSLTVAARDTGISPGSFKRHVGSAVNKTSKRGKWKAKRTDRISRVMTVFSNDRRFNIETRDSRTASIIGRYNSAVGHFTQIGDTSNLNKLKGVIIKDSSGHKYLLETNPKKVTKILERIEEPDVPTIYAI